MSIPTEVARVSTTSGLPAVKNVTRTVALSERCRTEKREPTPAEIASTYDFLPFDGSARHIALRSEAAQIVAANALGGPPPPAEPPKPRMTFAGIVAAAQLLAHRKSEGQTPNEKGIINKFAVDPARATILADRLAGGTVEPTDAELEKCLTPRQFLRVTQPGDIAIPAGQS